MIKQALTISFANGLQKDATPAIWLNLEQQSIPEVVQDVNLADLIQMYTRARSGLSAQTYRKPECPVLITGDDTATVTLDFYVWPSSMELSYSLTAGFGTISPPVRVDIPKDFDVLVPLSDAVDLGYLLNNEHVYWQTPAINNFGEIIARPDIEITNGQLLLRESVFSVIRLTGKAQGYKHSVTIQIDGTEENKITNLHESIIASWVDDNGKTVTETLDLKIPSCVESALEQCPDNGKWSSVSGTTTSEDGLINVIYYSDCSGKFLERRRERP